MLVIKKRKIGGLAGRVPVPIPNSLSFYPAAYPRPASMVLPGVGFIGLGNMGLPMARNLLKAGRRLVVHDLNPAVAAPLTAAGATFASSPAEVASAVTGEGGAVFTMLHSGAAVREVYTGADGLLSACKPQTLLVDCSTVEPATAREMSSARDDVSARTSTAHTRLNIRMFQTDDTRAREPANPAPPRDRTH